MALVRPRYDPVRILGRRLMLVGLLLLVALAVSGVWHTYQKERESAALRADAEAQLLDLSQRQAQLEGNIANLKTDRGVEGALRQQYALAGKGEGLIVIVDEARPGPSQATSSILQWFHRAFSWW